MDLPAPFLNAALSEVSFIVMSVESRFREEAWLIFTIVDKSLDSQERSMNMEGNTSGLQRFTEI